MKKDPIVFEKQISAGSRKYYFEILNSQQGEKCFELVERKAGEVTGRIVISEDKFEDFFEVMDEMMIALKIRHKVKLAGLRHKYPRAYEKWTAEDDEILSQLFSYGRANKEIAEILERQPSAIRSRIQKMALD